MNNPSLVVLAAGLGSRYGSLKQLDQFGSSGETIVDYTIYDAIQAGFKKIIFVIRKSIEEEFLEIFAKNISKKAEVHYVFQELGALPGNLAVPEGREKPWGTGHAVLMASDIVKEPFAIVNADDYYGRDSLKTIYQHLKGMDSTKLEACLVGYVLKNTLSEHGKVSRGVCEIGPAGYLKSIVERTGILKKGSKEAYFEENGQNIPLTGDEIVSMNLMGFTSKVFELIEKDLIKFIEAGLHNPKAEFYIPTVLDSVRAKGVKIPVLKTHDVWFGVTYKEDKPLVMKKLNELTKTGVYTKKLWNR